MRIYLKVRFDVTVPKFERVMDNKYLLYLPFPRDNESPNMIKGILSKKLGVIIKNIYFVMIDKNNDWVFDLDN